jgi:cellulose synthase (UDP-forming)
MSYSKYSYADTPTWHVRTVYAIGIVCWLGTVYGYIHFFMLNAWYWVFMAPFLLVASAYYLLSYSINLFYKKFDSNKHRQRAAAYWFTMAGPHSQGGNRLPTVDVLLPVCGEGIPILKKVWQAVDKLDYPKDKLNVFVLDDCQDDPEVKRMAKKFG